MGRKSLAHWTSLYKKNYVWSLKIWKEKWNRWTRRMERRHIFCPWQHVKELYEINWMKTDLLNLQDIKSAYLINHTWSFTVCIDDKINAKACLQDVWRIFIRVSKCVYVTHCTYNIIIRLYCGQMRQYLYSIFLPDRKINFSRIKTNFSCVLVICCQSKILVYAWLFRAWTKHWLVHQVGKIRN